MTDDETLRDVLLKHHPIAHTMTGPLSGCRCGQVKLGEDVIAHVLDHLRAALLHGAVLQLASDFDANGNGAALGDPSADAWHKAARLLRAALNGAS